jgi:transcriptional regulator with XRE-family HTH domain
VDPETAGQQIARARRQRGLSQSVLAGLIGRSESWLSQVERGRRSVDSHAVLLRLAAILRVDVEDITAPDNDAEQRGPRGYQAATLIEQAMMSYGTGADAEPRAIGSMQHMRATARSAYRNYQATRYEAAGRLLPRLIRDVEAASRFTGTADPGLCELRGLVYDTAAALLNRVGEPFLAWAAADRAMAAAVGSGDPLLAAAGAWRMSYMITGRKHPKEALELAMTAAVALESAMRTPSLDQLSVYGALHLAAATAAAAAYDRATTMTMLGKARDIACTTGDENRMGTAFGHTNVEIHAIATALQLGDARFAAETGEALDPAKIPPECVGRRTQLHLDLARAYATRRQDAAAVNLLLAAERLSPQLVRYDRRTGLVLAELLRREHRPSTPDLRPLAHRAGVI